MQKNEIIQLHVFLLQLRTQLVGMMEKGNSPAFLSYDEMNIFPQQVNKTKDEHKLAVFELCKGIAELLQEDDCSAFQKSYDRLEGMCSRFRKQKEAYTG